MVFLKKNNQINWLAIGVAFCVTAGLVLMGMFWLDAPLYYVFTGLNFGQWAWWFEFIFDGHVWIVVSGVALILAYVIKSVKKGIKYKNDNGCICVKTWIQDGINKTVNTNAGFIFLAVLSTGLIVKGLKYGIGRIRPLIGFISDATPTTFMPCSSDWLYNSMPSGHSAISFAGLVMIGLLMPRLKPVTWTVAVMIAVSRLMLGVHWFSDVVLGAFIGMVMADIVYSTVLKHKKK